MTSPKIFAWHGDADLKATVVARMRAHRAADTIIQRFYQEFAPDTATGYRGCAIGCTLPYQGMQPGRAPHGNWHATVEHEYGIDVAVAKLIDDTFEYQEAFEDAAEFAVAVIDAIPVGADLTPVVDAWHEAQMDDAEPRPAARWLVDQLTAAPIPPALP